MKATYISTDTHSAHAAGEGREVRWYALDDEEFGLVDNGTIVDAAGNPLTPGDRREIAARLAINEARRETYTVFSPNDSSVSARNLTLEQAACEIMHYDGHDFDIRPAADGKGFDLWTTPYSRNSTLGGKPMTQSRIFSLKADRAEAEADIYQQVIHNADWWKRECMTDEAFDAMQAETRADNDA
jgi:hypothetical protein